MGMSFMQHLHCLCLKRFHRPQSLLQPLQREMVPELTISVLIWRRMDQSYQENVFHLLRFILYDTCIYLQYIITSIYIFIIL